MSDITIIKERGQGGVGTLAKIFANNEEAFQILGQLVGSSSGLARSKCFTIHSEAAEEMAEALKEKGLDVEIK